MLHNIKRVWFIQHDKIVVRVRALYRLKSSGATFHTHLAESLSSIGSAPCNKANPDVWKQAETKANGDEYYSYL